MGQPGQMGMAVTPSHKNGVSWAHKDKKEFGESDQKCFDHYTFIVDYDFPFLVLER